MGTVFVGDRSAPDGFRTDVLRVGKAVLVAVMGELDIASAAHFQAAVEGVDGPETPSDVTVDLSRLEFIDAAGVDALVSLRNAVHRAGGRLRVRSSRPAVRRVLALAAVIDLLDVGIPPS